MHLAMVLEVLRQVGLGSSSAATPRVISPEPRSAPRSATASRRERTSIAYCLRILSILEPAGKRGRTPLHRLALRERETV